MSQKPNTEIAVRQGIGFLRTELPTILATRTDALSPRMLRVIEELAGDWRRLDQRIDGLTGEIEALARQDQACSRLMTVPGIGPIISSAMVAAIGTGDVFSKVLQRPRLRRPARTGAQADLDGRPHDPRQNLQARQSLPARSVRAGGMGCAGQDKELGTLRAQILDRSRQEAVAPQRAGDRARQQACPHRVGGAG